MKTLLVGMISALIANCVAQADFVIVQKVSGGQQNGTMTIRIKDGKARADIAPEVSQIMDGNTGDVITLMHHDKKFMRIPANQTKAMMERMQKEQQEKGGAKPALTPTGKMENVGPYAAEIYTWTFNQMSVKYWITKDFPNAQAILAALDKVQQSGLGALTKGISPTFADFPGMVVKTELTMRNQTLTTTLVSVAEQPIEASVFEVPQGYEEAPEPQIREP